MINSKKLIEKNLMLLTAKNDEQKEKLKELYATYVQIEYLEEKIIERFGNENTWAMQKFPHSVLKFYKEALQQLFLLEGNDFIANLLPFTLIPSSS